MSSELITSWTRHDSAVLPLVRLAVSLIRIFDEELVRLKLERPEPIDALRHFLSQGGQNRLEIVVRNAGPLRQNSPRLMKLLATYTHGMTIFEAPAHLATLNDSMLICDDRHALVRFHKEQPRARIMVDSPADCAPYVQRFADILGEGGEPVSATTIGL